MEPTPGLKSESLLAFLAPQVSRPEFIYRWLNERGVPAGYLELAGKRHVIVRYGTDSYDPNFRTKILVAHHDRTPGSPGANDNGAACFQLMLLAERLAGGARWKATLRKTHNTIILFTDGEEASGEGGIRAQGSFAIGSGLKTLGFDDADVFVFDACGRGDVLVLSSAGALSGKKDGRGGFPTGTAARQNAALRDRARDIAREAAPGKWVTLLTPYSDNAGFMASGIVSQVITVLPRAEADALLFALAGKGEGIAGARDIAALERLIVANARGTAANDAESARLLLLVPETWRLMHGPDDNPSTLTGEAFTLMKNFLDCLAASLYPV